MGEGWGWAQAPQAPQRTKFIAKVVDPGFFLRVGCQGKEMREGGGGGPRHQVGWIGEAVGSMGEGRPGLALATKKSGNINASC